VFAFIFHLPSLIKNKINNSFNYNQNFYIKSALINVINKLDQETLKDIEKLEDQELVLLLKILTGYKCDDQELTKYKYSEILTYHQQIQALLEKNENQSAINFIKEKKLLNHFEAIKNKLLAEIEYYQSLEALKNDEYDKALSLLENSIKHNKTERTFALMLTTAINANKDKKIYEWHKYWEEIPIFEYIKNLWNLLDKNDLAVDDKIEKIKNLFAANHDQLWWRIFLFQILLIDNCYVQAQHIAKEIINQPVENDYTNLVRLHLLNLEKNTKEYNKLMLQIINKKTMLKLR
jgi:antitoxin component HigA of HigAB toxin-antitoxin module